MRSLSVASRFTLAVVAAGLAGGILNDASAQLCQPGQKCGGPINWGQIRLAPAPAKARPQSFAPVFIRPQNNVSPLYPANNVYNPAPLITINPNPRFAQPPPTLYNQVKPSVAPAPVQTNLPSPVIVNTLPTATPNPYGGAITAAPTRVITTAPKSSPVTNPFAGTVLNPSLSKPTSSGMNPFVGVLAPVRQQTPSLVVSPLPPAATPTVAPHIAVAAPNPYAKVLLPPPVKVSSPASSGGAVPSSVNPYAKVLLPTPVPKSHLGIVADAPPAIATIPFDF